METKHTPGPWRAEAGAHGYPIMDASGGSIAAVWPTSLNGKANPVEANAHLIATAPAYEKAWALVPEEIRERVLSAAEPWVAEAIDAAARVRGEG